MEQGGTVHVLATHKRERERVQSDDTPAKGPRSATNPRAATTTNITKTTLAGVRQPFEVEGVKLKLSAITHG